MTIYDKNIKSIHCKKGAVRVELNPRIRQPPKQNRVKQYIYIYIYIYIYTKITVWCEDEERSIPLQVERKVKVNTRGKD